MTHLVFLLGACALLWPVLDKVASRFMGAWTSPEWSEKVTRLPVANRDDHSMVLFIGDSIVSTGIRPQFLSFRAYNLGRSSLLPRDLSAISGRIDDLGLQPKCIYLYITPEGFYHSDAIADGGFFENLQVAGGSFYAAPNMMGALWLPGRGALRLRALQGTLSAFTVKRSFFIDIDGSRLSIDSADNSQLPPFEPDPGTRSPRFQNQVRHQFAKFKEAWERRGVPVYWITMPIDPRRRAYLIQRFPYELKSAQQMIYEIFQHQICSPITALTTEDFRDGLHLSPEGARKLTLELDKELNTNSTYPRHSGVRIPHQPWPKP